MTRSAFTVEIDGLRGLRADLKRLGDDLGRDGLKDANARAAALVAGAARPRVHSSSGALAASGRGNRAAGRAVVMFGSAAVPYAGPNHYGWPARNIEPNEFAIDAAQQTEHVWLGIYQDDLDKIVSRTMEATY